jgi:signal transduction histidine kinase/ActR/RegA family two-component response regulator
MEMMEEKKSRSPLELLYHFTTASGAVTDVQALMTHFFNILSSAVDFQIGAYLVNAGVASKAGRPEGRVYARARLDKYKIDDFTRIFLKRAGRHAGGLNTDALKTLDVSVLMSRKGALLGGTGNEDLREAPVHSLELPILCWDEPAGVITLISYRKENPFVSSELISTMALHVSRVLERLLKHSQTEANRLTNVLSGMTEGVFIVEPDGVLTAANPISVEIVSTFCDRHIACRERAFNLGVPLPRPGTAVTADDCEFSRLLAKIPSLDLRPGSKPVKREIRNEAGRVVSVKVASHSSGGLYDAPYVAITARDVTEERAMEKSVLLSSKLASLGEMAAGIAHEINNPLQSVLGNLEMLEDGASEAVKGRVERVKDGVLRIKTIVRDLLSFARDQSTETVKADVNVVIEKTVEMTRAQLERAKVKVSLALDHKPLVVECNPNLLQQVFINLLQNAKDAIEEARKGSCVTVRTALLPGSEVLVEVADDGPGIPDEIIGKIFDPLFTTKDVGKGTGLGLSLSKKIIEGFGGSIMVSSRRGSGTAFRMSLPHSRDFAEQKRVTLHREPDYASLVDKKVLLVDDDEELLNAVSGAIASNVFTVETVGNAVDALARIKRNDYDVIFLDVKMPGMDGMDLFRNIIGNKPHLAKRVVFITGEAKDPRVAEFLRLTGSRYIAKPFSIKDMIAAMCEVGEAAGAEAGR